MRLISSRTTFFYKRIFPVFWFGFLAIFVAITLLSGQAMRSFDPMFFVGPIVMTILGWLIMRRFVFDLADEVVLHVAAHAADDGDHGDEKRHADRHADHGEEALELLHADGVPRDEDGLKE